MVKFSLFALSSFLCTVQAVASSSAAQNKNLRAPIGTIDKQTHRKLSYEYIARYRPASQVTDHVSLICFVMSSLGTNIDAQEC
jgi:hypothetical protein